jgi:YegS/Rv2252/BmrU family lipid kinase
MQCKKVCLVVNPRDGQNFAKIADILAVFSAAGWNTDIVLKEYAGHTMELAADAAKKGYDLVIAYGGDGTLNQVVNGVMDANGKGRKGQHSVVATVPGGTVNEWAAEISLPQDPVKAALALLNSDVRKIDLGYVAVRGLTFPDAAQNGQQTKGKREKGSSRARHHFLLMAGLGIDAAIVDQVNKTLKHKLGVVAVGLTAAQTLPEQHPFPVEVRAGDDEGVLWRGEALQVVIGNTRRYADYVEITPNAYIDDGIIDVCVITAGTPLSTMQQITSLLLRRKPDNLTAEYFSGPRLNISVPASIKLQLDGTTVKLKDYLGKSERKALEQSGDLEHVIVHYRFDAMPRALQIAVPHNYNNALFEKSASQGKSHATAQEQTDKAKSETTSHQETAETTHQHDDKSSEEVRQKSRELVDALLEQGREVTVIGVSPNLDNEHTYVIAGKSPKRSTGEIRPVAVCIDNNTTIIRSTGEHVPADAVQELLEGKKIVVDGRKSRRSVIHATRAVI